VLPVAQELATCISLPDGTIAQLNVARSLAKADSVSIELFNEGDWEILESHSDLILLWWTIQQIKNNTNVLVISKKMVISSKDE
jgi:hypothetical protein